MCPRSMMSPTDLEKKIKNFYDRKGTTHWPCQNVIPSDRVDYYDHVPRRPDGTPDAANRVRPVIEPKETPEVLALVGIRV